MFSTAMALAGALAASGLAPTNINFTTTPEPARRVEPSRVTATSADGIDLTILTYNIHGLPWPLTKGRPAALRQIGRELAQMRAEGRQPDIVLIQEGFGEDFDELARLSGYKYRAKGPARADRPNGPKPAGAERYRPGRYPQAGEGWGKLTNSGLHVLSDRPILDVQTLAFRYCAGFDCLANKGVMLVHVAAPGAPDGVDILNTHLNSRGAAKVPYARSLIAHNLQLDELTSFLESRHVAGRPLLVGGDFNVRNAPDRYEHGAERRPFTVVAEYCNTAAASCVGETPSPAEKPWLLSEDLQAFDSRGGAAIRPIEVQTLFGPDDTGRRLSDHNGYFVRYRMSPSIGGPTRIAVALP